MKLSSYPEVQELAEEFFWLVLVYLPCSLPRRNPCEWGSTYWRAAGVCSTDRPWLVKLHEDLRWWLLFFFVELQLVGKTAAAKGSDREANIVLVLQSVNKMMASTSCRFVLLLQYLNRAEIISETRPSTVTLFTVLQKENTNTFGELSWFLRIIYILVSRLLVGNLPFVSWC